MFEKIFYNGWPNCIRLFNEDIEVIVTTDIGPRIVSAGFIHKQNFFYLVPEHAGTTGGNDWRIYGGHRFWLAPEAIPFSYNPDNEKVAYAVEDNCLIMKQPKESLTGMVKEMEITLFPDKNEVRVLHRLINQNERDIEVAPWALSMMAQGGLAIVPQEPYGEGDDFLLPARPLALWQFTKMNDPRWIWGAKFIRAKQDPSSASEQKIGVLNKQGWTAYCLNGELLIKRFDYQPGSVYPDYGCNNEIYINGRFLEIETLGPLAKVPPAGVVEHLEHWLLSKAQTDGTEESIDAQILPLVNQFHVKE
jgi:hypothetical protein